jgi:hypothetical protein
MRYWAIATEIFNSIADGENGTLDIMGYDLPGYGYFVGGEGAPLVFGSVEDGNRSTAMRAIRDFVGKLSGRYVGWWADEETGKIYVDGTTWFSSEHEAARTARERKEIAIYDIERKRELRIVYVEGEV